MALTQVEELLVDMLKYSKGLGAKDIAFALYALKDPREQLSFMKWLVREDPTPERIMKRIVDKAPEGMVK